MNAKAFAIAILTFTAPLGATAQETCTILPEDPKNCARFVSCINEGETLFKGTSQGWQNGTLYGESTTGVTCTGTWSYDARLDKGEGSLICSDGESADINFFARGKNVQAITGVAITEQGNRLPLWGSPDLSAFFPEKFPDAPVPGQTYQCEDTWIPLPTKFLDVPRVNQITD